MQRAPGNSRPRATSLYYFDAAAADRACDFFPRFLVHFKGEWAGQPFELQDWQKKEIVRPLFGWKRRSDGTRRYRLLYLEEPRKNGKSMMAAGIGCYLLYCDQEPGAEIYGAAKDRSQAGIVFEMVAEMVKASEELRRRSKVFRRRIFVPATLSFYQVLSADVGTKHGLNPHGIIFDELHVQERRDLWDTLRTGRGSRRQPMTVAMTTAGYERDTICREQHDKALAILEGYAEDDTFLPVVYGLGQEEVAKNPEAWRDPEVWTRVNPNLGVTFPMSYLEEEYREAVESPAFENTFRRLHLNEWVTQFTRWIEMSKWERCGSGISMEDLLARLEGKPCWGGLDLSTVTDLSAFVLVFPTVLEASDPDYPTEEDAGGPDSPGIPAKWEYGDPLEVFDVLCWFWCPEEGIALRSRRDKVNYELWAKEGSLNPTPGDAVDHEVIRQTIGEIGKRYIIQEIAADAWNAHELLTQLAGDGFQVVRMSQGYGGMTSPTKALDALYRRRRLRHGGHPVLSWCASNAALEKDAYDNWKPSKKRSRERIDGVVALVMALGKAMLDREGDDFEDGLVVVKG